MSLPPGGISIEWLEGVELLKKLISEGIRRHGEPMKKFVRGIEANLEGSALFAWEIADGLIEIHKTVHSIECQMRVIDRGYGGCSLPSVNLAVNLDQAPSPYLN